MRVMRFLIPTLLALAPVQAVAMDVEEFHNLERIGGVSPTPVCDQQDAEWQPLGCFFLDLYDEPVFPASNEDAQFSFRIIYQPDLLATSIVRVDLTREPRSIAASFNVRTTVTTPQRGEETRGIAYFISEEDTTDEIIARDFQARSDEAWLVLRALNPTEFWEIPSQHTPRISCLHGTTHTLEMMDREHYHLVELPCGGEPDPRHDAVYELINLVALIARSHLADEVSGFPY